MEGEGSEGKEVVVEEQEASEDIGAGGDRGCYCGLVEESAGRPDGLGDGGCKSVLVEVDVGGEVEHNSYQKEFTWHMRWKYQEFS